MKISFLINSMTSGGAERVAAVLTKELSKTDQVLFYTLERDRFYRLGEKVVDTPLSRNSASSSFSKKLLFLPLLTAKYFREVKRRDPDVLVSFLELSNFVSIFVARLLKKPVVISPHNCPSLRFRSQSLYDRLHRFLIRKFYPLADRIVCVSKVAALDLERNFSLPRERLKVVYNCHDVDEYVSLSEKELPQELSEFFRGFVFIAVGRLSAPKGFWHLLRCFSAVTEKLPQARLLILGEGPDRPQLERLAKGLGVADRILMPGRQKNPFPFLKRSGCFVMTSLTEGLPNALIEALSLNLPIISTDCLSGPREILAPEVDVVSDLSYPYFGRWGILSRPFSGEKFFETTAERPLTDAEKEFSELMVKIGLDSDLRRKYSRGRERAHDFRSEHQSREWRKVLLEVV